MNSQSNKRELSDSAHSDMVQKPKDNFYYLNRLYPFDLLVHHETLHFFSDRDADGTRMRSTCSNARLRYTCDKVLPSSLLRTGALIFPKSKKVSVSCTRL
ncbi:hypothetical protein OUZ56_009786 [Daphnia magna]|uniref:Uncharacterized protein n=1 Tax=Daphnia magna TaxID=35525 RepID=A0ABR0AGW1_9CRUS|nr:hypothetical protein OUZ56_009786 [Daphnia magna]